MTRRCVFFAVEAGIEFADCHQRNAIVGRRCVYPSLHRGSDRDENVLVLIRRGDGDGGINYASQRWGEAVSDGALRPRAVNQVHLQAARTYASSLAPASRINHVSIRSLPSHTSDAR